MKLSDGNVVSKLVELLVYVIVEEPVCVDTSPVTELSPLPVDVMPDTSAVLVVELIVKMVPVILDDEVPVRVDINVEAPGLSEVEMLELDHALEVEVSKVDEIAVPESSDVSVRVSVTETDNEASVVVNGPPEGEVEFKLPED